MVRRVFVVTVVAFALLALTGGWDTADLNPAQIILAMVGSVGFFTLQGLGVWRILRWVWRQGGTLEGK